MACPRDGPGASCPAGRRKLPCRPAMSTRGAGAKKSLHRAGSAPARPVLSYLFRTSLPRVPQSEICNSAPPESPWRGILAPFHNIQTNCRNFLLHIDFIFSKTNFIYQKIIVDIKSQTNCISTVNYSSWTGKFPDFLLQNFRGLTQSLFFRHYASIFLFGVSGDPRCAALTGWVFRRPAPRGQPRCVPASTKEFL